MARDFRLPDVGEGIREAEVIKWMVDEGDHVEEDEGVLEVETDKAIIEIPSPVTGELTEKLYEVGATVSVGDVVARFETTSIQTPETDGSSVAADARRPEAEPSPGGVAGGRVFAAPSTRRLARERGVDIENVEGTGPGGRVTRADVERAAEQQEEDLPPEVARRKARKEFERRKWRDDESDEDQDDGDGGGSSYETAFQDDDAAEEDHEGGIIIGDDSGETPGGEGETTEPAGRSGEADGGRDGGGDDAGGTEASGGSAEDPDAGDDGLAPEFTESVGYVDSDEDGLAPEFTEEVAEPEEDDGLTPEFTEEVADVDEDEDDGLTPEFQRDAATVDRTSRAPDFDEDEHGEVDVGDGSRVGREEAGEQAGEEDGHAEDDVGEPAEADDGGEEEELDIERVEEEVDEAGPILEDGADGTSGYDEGEAESTDEAVDGAASDVAEAEEAEPDGASGSREKQGADGHDDGASSAEPVRREPTGKESFRGGEVEEGSPGSGATEDAEVSYTGNRRRMGEKLSEAVQRPLVTLHDEVDVERLHEVQEEVDDVTYTPFVVKASVAALADHPALNSGFDEDAEEVVLHDDFHVGVATSTDDGLRVPVLEDADTKDIAELSRELDGLVERARSGELSDDETGGGTFTVTNFGAVGGEYSTPIVNGDEAAVLALGEVRQRPRVVDGELEPRHVVTLSLTFDQRMVDGAEAARFTNEVRRYLRKPALLLVD